MLGGGVDILLIHDCTRSRSAVKLQNKNVRMRAWMSGTTDTKCSDAGVEEGVINGVPYMRMNKILVFL